MSESAARPPIRVGLLVNSMDVPSWSYEVLEEIIASEWGEVALVVKNRFSQPRRPIWKRLRTAGQNAAYIAYEKLDQRIYRKRCRPSAFSSRSISELLVGVPVMEVNPRRTTFSDYLEDDDIQQIQDASIDVLLRWAFRILRGKILTVAKYGVWSFHHGDSRVNRGTMPGFWEVMEGVSTTGSVLQVLSEQLDAGTIVERHTGATETESVALNQHSLYWKTAPMLVTNLKRLHAEGATFLTKKASLTVQPYCEPLRMQPTNWETLRGIGRIAGRFLSKKAQHLLHYDQWFLAYRIRRRQDDPNLAFYQYKTILPPKHLFWADPFVVERDGKYFVFFEEFVFAKDRAHISVLEIDKKGRWSSPRPVIVQPYHMSYPFLFEYQDELWMIPETAQNRTIELYRCTQFPDQWTKETVLMDELNAVDTTLHEHNGRWWMFVCIAEKNLRNRDTLYLFYADSPLGPWTPHPHNPIKRDVRSARPAGCLFTQAEKLIRPAQDCAERYGAATTFNEVLELSEEGYREQVIARVSPDWDPAVVGTHTINSAGDLTIIDGEMLRRRLF